MTLIQYLMSTNTSLLRGYLYNICQCALHDTWHQVQPRTVLYTSARTRQYSKPLKKPLNRPKRKQLFKPKMRPGRLSPPYHATVWAVMGQREGTIFPFCSKFSPLSNIHISWKAQKKAKNQAKEAFTTLPWKSFDIDGSKRRKHFPFFL